MAIPILRLDQGDTGTAGASRDNLTIGPVINIVDTVAGNVAGPNVTELAGKPTGSSATIVNPTSFTSQLTMDMQGAYLIKRTFNNDPAQVSYIIAASRENPNAWRYPAPGERTEFGPDGWHPAIQEILDTLNYGTLKIDGEILGAGLALLTTSIQIDEVDSTLGSNNLYIQMTKGSVAATSPAGTGRIRYNESLNRFEQSINGGAWTELAGSGGGGGPGSDTTAIHVNLSDEINTSVSVKALPALTDIILIEDSAGATWDKKKITLAALQTALGSSIATSLGTTGSPVDVGSSPAPATGEALIATGPTTATWQTLAGKDTDAIHDNVAGEITALAGPAGGLKAADEFLVEDTSAGNVKAKASIQDLIDILPAGGGGPGVGGLTGWQLVETKEVTGADASSLTFTGLDGNVDEEYHFEINVTRTVDNGLVRDLYLLPNGLTTGATSYFHNIEGVSVVAKPGLAVGYMWDGTGAVRGDHSNVAGEFIAATNPQGSSVAKNRRMHAHGYLDDQSDGSDRRLQRWAGTWLDTSTNVTSIEFRLTVVGVPATPVAELAIGSTISLYKRATGAASVSGGLEFVDEIIVTVSAVTSVTFGTGGDGLLDRALDGNVDDEYVIVGDIVKGAASSAYSLQPNGVATDQDINRIFSDNGAAPAADKLTQLSLATSGATGGVNETICGFEANLSAKTGYPRSFRSFDNVGDTVGTTETRVAVYGGVWGDTSTNITSLDIVSSVASGIGVGSRIRLFRRTSQNVRADAANTSERQATAVLAQGTNAETEYTVGRTNFNGSAVAVSVSLDGTQDITAGTLTAKLKVAGATVLTHVMSAGDYGRANASIGAYKVATGEEVILSVETDASFATTGGGNVGVVLTGTLTNEALIQPPAGGMVHVKTIRVDNTPQDTITFSDLDGDADGIYVLQIKMVSITTPFKELHLNPNGLTSNQEASYSFGGSSAGGAVSARWTHVLFGSTFMDGLSGTTKIFAKTGKDRSYTFYGEASASADTDRWRIFGGGQWTDTTTNLTSLVLVSDVTNAFDVGSEFHLYKLTEGANVEVL